MPVTALALALGAALLHALWNLGLAGARDTEATTAVALVAAVVLFAPVAALTADVRAEALPYIAASAALELAYFALLAAAYGRAELSVVYPLSRGLAPVLVLAIGVAALSDSLSWEQAAGVALVAAGVMLVRDLRWLGDPRDVVFSLAIAATIAGYTLVDNEGLRYADPIAYLELVMVVPAVAYFAATVRRRGAVAMRAAATPRTVAIAVGMFGAYALTLAALELASAASVAAVRESSVVIATALAGLALKEAVTRRRLAGSVVVVAGIALLAAA
ncbi:MAG: EamA family transporter [Solirubrobacteraceae bacterium]